MRALPCCCFLPRSKALNSCCGPAVGQAPPYRVGVPTPTSIKGIVGSLVRKVKLPPMKKIGTNPATCYMIFTPPFSARLQSCQVPTTAKGCGANPGPISAVGIVSPQMGAAVTNGGSSAPVKSSTWWYVAIAVAVALWMFGGLAVIRRML